MFGVGESWVWLLGGGCCGVWLGLGLGVVLNGFGIRAWLLESG